MMSLRQTVKRGFYAAQRSVARMQFHFSAPGTTEKFALFNLHSITPAKSDMAVSPARFRDQISALLRDGYRCLDFGEVLQAVNNVNFLSQRAFSLTFDDGYRSVYEEAWPVLQEFGASATIFVCVNFIGGRVAPPWHSNHPALVREYADNVNHFRPLEWSQLREMARDQRIRVGSHSLNHFLMGKLSGDRLREELRQSKQILEDRLGVAVSFFSYPYGVGRYGAYSKATEEAVREAGYSSSSTSEIGRVSTGTGNPFLLPRISLVNDDTKLDALAKAAGGYDWVGLAQSAYQRIFSNPHGA